MFEFDSPLWGMVADLLLIGVGTVIAVLGWLLKSKIERFEADRTELERRLEKKLDGYFNQVRNEMSEIERIALGVKSELHEKMGELPDKFVPRYELQEIVRSMRDAAQHNAEGVASMNRKLDKVLMILAGNKE